MSQSLQRILVALFGAAAVLIVAAWIDAVLLHSILVTGGTAFGEVPTSIALPVGYLLVIAGVLVIARLAGSARSRLVEIVYVVVGVFWDFLFTLVWTVAAVSANAAPPVLPDPLASAIGQTYTATEEGPLHAVALIGAAMVVAGASRLALSLRHRPAPVTT